MNLTNFNERVETLKGRIEEEKEVFNKKKLTEKLAKLTGKMVIIHVGGITEAVAKEKFDRVEDAVYATRAAIEEGVSIGGGMTYYGIFNKLNSKIENIKTDIIGYSIALKALLRPFLQLCENCNVKLEPAIWLNKPVYNGSTFDIRITGYNFLNDTWVNMREAGIIDPTKVLRVAIENAISVASIIITTSGIITKE